MTWSELELIVDYFLLFIFYHCSNKIPKYLNTLKIWQHVNSMEEKLGELTKRIEDMEKNFRALRDAICLDKRRQNAILPAITKYLTYDEVYGDDNVESNNNIVSECSRKMMIEEFKKQNPEFKFPEGAVIEKNDRFIATLLDINKNSDIMRNYFHVIILLSKGGSDIEEFCNITEKILRMSSAPSQTSSPSSSLTMSPNRTLINDSPSSSLTMSTNRTLINDMRHFD
jgi:hypothetical protein